MITILFNGVTYTVPETGDESWGESLTSYLVAIPQGALQKSGGAFTLTSDVNFGANYGLLSKYFSTRTALPSTAGLVRMAVTDTLGWRNNANSANLLLGIDGSDNLTFNGGSIPTGGITALTGDVTATGPGSAVATIAVNAVTSAKFRQSAALSVVGNATNATANVTDISAGSDGMALVRTGTALNFALLLNANISASAAIAYSKLNLTGSIVNADVNGSAAIAYSKLALTGSIVNADVNVSAAIAYSKLSLSNSILNADINSSAAIAYSKLALTGSILNADINASAAIAYSKLALTGSIVNADISASAAIANSKLATMVTATVKGNISGSTATPSDVSLVSAATASTVMFRDSNGNTSVNNISKKYTTTATATGTTILTVASEWAQYFTGTLGQIAQLPDATTLPQTGFGFYVVNLSSGIVTIKDAGLNTVQAIPAASYAFVTAKSIGSANGSWDVQYSTNNAGGGTVTSVTFTGDGTVLSSTPSSAVTTSGTVTATLANATARTFLSGPLSGSAAPGSYKALTVPVITLKTSTGTTTGYLFTISTSSTVAAGDTYTNNGNTYTVLGALTAQSGQVLFTSQASAPQASGNLTRATGSGTATIAFTLATTLATHTCQTSPPPLYLKVKGAGGGGGGGGGGNSAGNGGTGTGSFFGVNLLVANGGTGGQYQGVNAAGGTASVGSASGPAITGGTGGGYNFAGTANIQGFGGYGGNTPYFGGGGSQIQGGQAGQAGLANTGGGGSGGGIPNAAGSNTGGAGGGSGGFVDALVPFAATFVYAVGTGGSSGTAGTGGAGGGTGAAGTWVIEEHFQ